MILNEPEYCACGWHLVDPAGHRPICPVCVDKAVKAAEARVVAMGWAVAGGRA